MKRVVLSLAAAFACAFAQGAAKAVKAAWSGELLERIARSSAFWRLRADAVYFLAEESVKRDIFENDTDWRVKAAALYNMADGEFLRRVACDAGADSRLRAAAASRLRDRSVLEALAADGDELLRQMAKKRLAA